MSSKNSKYTQEYKQTIVNLYHSGKTYSEIHKGYGVSHSALSNWIKQYSELKIDDETYPSTPPPPTKRAGQSRPASSIYKQLRTTASYCK